ncbi:hypothetical protein PGTUg99_032005 [Puccinia graminis f. sp. tritici]|uniref:Uncharacterized protein n=1 Tax=Puccinia graminis f. sp. tritici TaxID=56615 RepID=A0A5B0S9S3_PUCGR|nr:hypothetical protein PGTUg99_032005 [Puccinia graminis f. sp. tritici]
MWEEIVKASETPLQKRTLSHTSLVAPITQQLNYPTTFTHPHLSNFNHTLLPLLLTTLLLHSIPTSTTQLK